MHAAVVAAIVVGFGGVLSLFTASAASVSLFLVVAIAWLSDNMILTGGVSFPFRYSQVSNWSGTHSVIAKQVLRPESTAEVEDIIREAHASGQRIRVFGNALSPNGFGLSDGGTMLSMVCCDKVLISNRRGDLRKGMQPDPW